MNSSTAKSATSPGWASRLSIVLPNVLHDRLLRRSLLGAALLHAGLIFGLSFSSPGEDQAAMQDIAVAVRLSQKPDKRADYLAQANQQGSGVLRQNYRVTSPEQAPASDDQIQAAEQQNMPQKQQDQSVAQQAGEQVLVTTLSWDHRPNDEKNEKESQKAEQAPQDFAFAAMISSLEAQYARRKQEYSRKKEIHTVDSVSARSDPSAAYLDYFRQKVEQLGNRHYPEAARAQHLSGDVRLMVILTPHGQVRALRLLKSSGSTLLDEAARNSVRQGAPYREFTSEMKHYSELRIIRTWRFSEQAAEMAIDN